MSDKFDEMARKCASQIVYEMLYNAREPMYPAEDRVTLRIAALVAREVEREREECAKIVEDADVAQDTGYGSGDNGRKTLCDAAAAIRARSAQGGERG